MSESQQNRGLLAAMAGEPMSEKFGIILGSDDRVEFRVEDFIHYYRCVKASFLAMQDGFAGDIADCPEPMPRAEHGRWSSLAEKFFNETDHLVQVAGISVGQIKKLKAAGMATVAELAAASGKHIRKLGSDSFEKLVAQARLQCRTREDRKKDPDAVPRSDILSVKGENGESLGLASVPLDDPADVYFRYGGLSFSGWRTGVPVRGLWVFVALLDVAIVPEHRFRTLVVFRRLLAVDSTSLYPYRGPWIRQFGKPQRPS